LPVSKTKSGFIRKPLVPSPFIMLGLDLIHLKYQPDEGFYGKRKNTFFLGWNLKNA